MEVAEIFESISGEFGSTTRQGSLVTFIRFFGCPIGCAYCDSPDSWKSSSYTNMTPEEILSTVEQLGNKHVIITGGEPVCQKELPTLLEKLCASDSVRNVVIETSGIHPGFTLHPEFDMEWKIDWAADYKLPSSKSEYANLNTFPWKEMEMSDLVKFLILTEEDLGEAIDAALSLIEITFDNSPRFVFTPGPNINVDQMIRRLKENGINFVINVQIHKILGVA